MVNKEGSQADIENITYNGVEITHDQVISETFNEHFVTIGKKLATGNKQSGISSSDYSGKIGPRDEKLKTQTDQTY